MRISDWSSDVCSSDLRRLRGRAGTEVAAAHGTGTPFVLLDDPALLPVPTEIAGWAASGAAVLQWADRNSTAVTEVPIPAAAQALRPLSPVDRKSTRLNSSH